MYGPIPSNNPLSDEHPGPPLNQKSLKNFIF